MEPHIGILAFTTQDTISHKIKNGKHVNGHYAWWRTSNIPTLFTAPENKDSERRLYLATDGTVRGYFIIHNTHQIDLLFDGDSWTPIKNGEQLTPSQGWRYYNEEEHN